jgi:transcriptional regulator with XRE-family HTH domain
MQLFRFDCICFVPHTMGYPSQEAALRELRRVRRSKGFSQRALAKAAGVSPSTIYELESGRRSANPSTLAKLAVALGVEIVDLLEEPDRPKATAPPSLAEWLEERCGHAYLALPKAEFEEMFDQLPEDDPERRARALEINHEYNVFCKFPHNVTSAERLVMRGMLRRAIPEVAVKHGIALMEGGLEREYQEEAALVFELERALDAEAEIA